MMPEYIEREALLQDIEDSVRFTAKTGTISPEMRGANKIIDRIKCAPAADVEPVRHAHWEYWDGWMSNHDMRIECVCSACGYKDVVRGYGYDNIKHLPERCHGCWAKMDERKDK